jgi:FMN phosphatase YigB (HAD superfamily)
VTMVFRVAFDLDGVLADLDRALLDLATRLFGSVEFEPASPADSPADADRGTGIDPRAGDQSDTAASGEGEQAIPVPPRMRLSRAQQRLLWDAARETENFWETLPELEKGAVARLARLAGERGWEVAFLTQRPVSAGDTVQLQSQRWLVRQGFPLPSVFVVSGSRGQVAAALSLDAVVDDREDNCLDVAAESGAKAVLVWRDDPSALDEHVARRGIAVVHSFAECLQTLVPLDERGASEPGVIDRLKRLFRSEA